MTNSTSSGNGFSRILLNMLVEAPRFLSSRSILFIHTVIFIIAFFIVTILSRSSSSVHEDISFGMQHLNESFLSLFSRSFTRIYASEHLPNTCIIKKTRLIRFSFQNATLVTKEGKSRHVLNIDIYTQVTY